MTAAEVGILIANLIVFGLNLKLYTETLKDRNMERRHGAR